MMCTGYRGKKKVRLRDLLGIGVLFSVGGVLGAAFGTDFDYNRAMFTALMQILLTLYFCWLLRGTLDM